MRRNRPFALRHLARCLYTNGLFSAFLERGLCADLLLLVLTDHTLSTSEVVNPRRCWEQLRGAG